MAFINYSIYKNTKKALHDHVDEQDKMDGIIIYDRMGRPKTPVLISESGLYALIFESKLPQAHQFQHWVTKEVLPSVMRNGMYIAGQENMTDEEILEKATDVAHRILEEREKKQQQQYQDTIDRMLDDPDYGIRMLTEAKNRHDALVESNKETLKLN